MGGHPPPSLYPAAAQHPDPLLSRGEGGSAAWDQALENGVSWQGCLLMVPAEM